MMMMILFSIVFSDFFSLPIIYNHKHNFGSLAFKKPQQQIYPAIFHTLNFEMIIQMNLMVDFQHFN